MKLYDIITVAVQGIDDRKEEIKTADRGTYKKIPEGFLIRYTENIFKDAPQVFTEIIISPEKTVTITKDGGIKSKLIIEEGRDNNCLYSTPIGSMDLTVSGERVAYILTDTGGEVYLSYSIKQNENLVSKNSVTITIKEV
ncbi:MAG: DUF1934 domain-containing protein [Clostridia bacterium]|nr:DUF1934 domain-containing protein [Clostridia bacterium]